MEINRASYCPNVSKSTSCSVYDHCMVRSVVVNVSLSMSRWAGQKYSAVVKPNLSYKCRCGVSRQFAAGGADNSEQLPTGRPFAVVRTKHF